MIAKERLAIIYCNEADEKYGPALKQVLRNITFEVSCFSFSLIHTQKINDLAIFFRLFADNTISRTNNY